MIKNAEINAYNSCLNKANQTEMLFVLRAHDVAFVETVINWVGTRLRLGKNKLTDPEIQEALECARIAEKQQEDGI